MRESLARKLIDQALRAGAAAANHNYDIPFPVLLDMETALHAGGVRALGVRLPAQTCDEDLRKVYNHAARCLKAWHAAEMRDVARSAMINAGAYLPLLYGLFKPAEKGKCLELAEAYRTLLQSPACISDIYKLWKNAARASSPVVFARPFAPPPPMRDLLTLFASQADAAELHEQFEHVAAHLYLNAGNPQIPSDLARRIQVLRRRMHTSDRPIVSIPDEQNPRQGAIPISVLVQDYEKAVHDIVNHEKPRLNRYPPDCRPTTAEIQIFWYCGYASAARELDYPFAADSGQTPRASVAAVVKGLTALLLEDWCHVLYGVRNVRISLTQGWDDLSPSAPSQTAGASKNRARDDRNVPAHRTQLLPCRRWRGGKPALNSAEHTVALPPPGVVSLLFAHHSIAELELLDTWRRTSPENDWLGPVWRCCVLSREDILALGFSPEEGAFDGNAGTIPSGFQHLIVLDDLAASGGIWRVTKSADGKRDILSCLHQVDAKSVDFSFSDLRIAVLRVLVARLETLLM